MSKQHNSTATVDADSYLDAVAWDTRGLAPAIAQDAESGQVLMLAWMDRAALAASIDSGLATYWSRSRGQLWRKGETSGHVQHIVDIRLDCDQDALLLRVHQDGGIACHTGRASCFYKALAPTTAGTDWVSQDPVIKNPEQIYS